MAEINSRISDAKRMRISHNGTNTFITYRRNTEQPSINVCFTCVILVYLIDFIFVGCFYAAMYCGNMNYYFCLTDCGFEHRSQTEACDKDETDNKDNNRPFIPHEGQKKLL